MWYRGLAVQHRNGAGAGNDTFQPITPGKKYGQGFMSRRDFRDRKDLDDMRAPATPSGENLLNKPGLQLRYWKGHA